MAFWNLSVTIGNLWVLVANAGVQNSAVTRFIASTGFGVTAFQMLSEAGRIAEVGRALRARHLAETGVQRTARPTGTRARGLLAGDVENDAETRFAAHHSVVRLGGFFQGKNFVHGMHVRRRTKF